MSRDVYGWYDAIEEHEGKLCAERREVHAYSDGFTRALAQLNPKSLFHRALEMAVSNLAERVAEEIIFDNAREMMSIQAVRERIQKLRLDILNAVRPKTVGIMAHDEFRLAATPSFSSADKPCQVVVRAEEMVCKPFVYAYALNPADYDV